MDVNLLLLRLEALEFRLQLLEKENADLKKRLSKYNNLNKALKTCFEPMNISYTFKNPKSIELKNK